MLIHNAVLTGSLTLPTSLPITGSLLVSGSLGIGMTPSRALDVTGTFRVITPNRSFFVTTNAYSISDGTLSSGIGMDSAGLYLGNVASSTGWTISNPQLSISAAGTSSFGGTSISSAADAATITIKQLSTVATNGIYLERNGEQKGYYIYVGGSVDSLNFRRNNAGTKSDVMSLTRDGFVGINNTSPGSRLHIVTTNGATKAYDDTSKTNITVFDDTSMAAGVGGSITFGGYKTAQTNGGNFAAIDGVKENGTAGNEAGTFRIWTANSSGVFTERMRITSTGYLKATSTGTYNDLNAQNHEFVNGTEGNNSHFIGNTNTSFGGASLLRLNCSRVTTNGTYNLIAATNGNSSGEFLVRDSGNVLNTNNSYTGTSDIKLKQDIIDANSQWEDIKQMRIRKFRFKKQVEQDENAPYLLGVIAQELELISPNLVDEALDFDGADEEVTSTTKSVKYSIIYMKAVKALQEAMAKIETLETTIETLTTRITALEN
jgi:hypothetical protein